MLGRTDHANRRRLATALKELGKILDGGKPALRDGERIALERELTDWHRDWRPRLDDAGCPEVELERLADLALQALLTIAETHGLRIELECRLAKADSPRVVYRDGTPATDMSFGATRGSPGLGKLMDSLLPVRFRGPHRGLADTQDRVAPVAIHPAIGWDREVTVGQTFTVRVAIHKRPGKGTMGVAFLIPDKPGPVTIDIAVHLPEGGAITAAEGLSKKVQINGDHEPAIEFVLTARKVGYHELQVAIAFCDLEIWRVPVHVLVRQSGAEITSAKAEASAKLDMVPGNREQVVLHIEDLGLQNGRQLCRLHLRGPSRWIPNVPPSMTMMPGNAQALLVELSQTIRKTLAEVSNAENRERRLRHIGAGLASTLLTPDIERALREMPMGTPLHIESADAWAPWEAVWVGDSFSGFFVGERFAITRSLLSGTMDATLPGGRAVLVAPSASNLDSEVEAAALGELASEPPRAIGTWGAVCECLHGEAKIGFLHFTCHGKAEPDSLHGGWLKLEGGDLLRPMDVPRGHAGHGAPSLAGTCVVINACQAGIETDALYDRGAWARRFLQAGAGAVIAPSWSIADPRALDFASRFYKELGNGRTLAEAARCARSEASKQGSPDRLAYAVFAAPYARLG